MLHCSRTHAESDPLEGGDWYNFAAAPGRQVVRDDRCGSKMTDIVTPEYATYPARLVSLFRCLLAMLPPDQSSVCLVTKMGEQRGAGSL